MAIFLTSLAVILLCSQTTGFLFGVIENKVCCPEVGCFPTNGAFRHLPPPTCVEDFGVIMLLYSQETLHQPTNMTRHGQIPSTFNPSVKTMFLIHGYRGTDAIQWMHDAKNYLLSQGPANIILVGWEHGADDAWYPNSAANTRTVGAEIALMADRFKNEMGLPSSNLWCVGFSLGGQTCGFTGARTNFARITGLDPAGPWFAGYDPAARLDPTDADFVDVIHCDGDSTISMGTLQQLGHMDFYPNGGDQQPGCLTNFKQETGPRGRFNRKVSFNEEDFTCSHMRAPQYWVESLTGADCFRAPFLNCTDSTNVPGSCTPCIGGNCAQMGVHAGVWYLDHYPEYAKTSNQSIAFYLETNYQAPFCFIN